MWYYNGKVGTLWKVVQLKFCERERFKSADLEQECNNTENVYNKLMILED